MKRISGALAIAFLLSAQCLPASAQNASAGAFGSMSPGAYGNGGGGQSDFQTVRESMVKKMRDGTYADLVRQGQENMDAFVRLKEREAARR
ncbi:hypothetical protein [Microvirga flavescens]|uniref:hypothetical protein n=1 Tax=Microvirga flavescens TaxID=2249811 RepID=UPI000DDAFFEA|nr:hypothetical protein [Microvirga flavescens]